MLLHDQVRLLRFEIAPSRVELGVHLVHLGLGRIDLRLADILCSQKLPLPPYALGVWLGDGHPVGAGTTTADPEIVVHLEADGLHLVAQEGLSYGLPQGILHERCDDDVRVPVEPG